MNRMGRDSLRGCGGTYASERWRMVRDIDLFAVP